MGRLSERLAIHTIIGLDTSVFIYHLGAHPVYLSATQELLAGVEAGQWTAVTSTVMIMELTVRPWQLNRPAVARAYEALLVNFPNLILADVTRDVARRAAQLRARYRLRPADALQVATALVHEATAFVTNDRLLTRLSPVLDVVMLDDFVLPGDS
ncbi:MAG: type II toxin-antitoxin system VapC family toxin [Anaerolineae bacterium]|jgi:predicted nucleic acid-binding protein|nr:type II toxin-antitoxin system VapC family toxin [Anaerolineae bacterium]MDH7475318.1 type II toxin-antitoxin system VapC family toxin [Anaerolineae bacterium]